MAQILGCNRASLARKLAKKSVLNLDEAFGIQQKCFPELDVAYLFAEASENQ